MHRFKSEGRRLLDLDLGRVALISSRSEIGRGRAHRRKKDIQQMSLFEGFIAEGNEKVDELAKEGAMMDGGLTMPPETNSNDFGRFWN